LQASSDFRAGLDSTGQRYLVSALRGIGRAQDLYTLDPDVTSDEVMTDSYEHYLALEK
jgi:adenylate cyclase